MKIISTVFIFVLFCFYSSFAQVDTTYLYNPNTPYGVLDIRIAKSATQYYYLQENKTFSYRESAPGVKTDTYKDMTSWNSAPYTQGNMREINGSKDVFVMNYRLLFPVSYKPAYSPGYPIIIMMHGAAERGNCWDGKCYHGTTGWSPITNNPAAPTAATFELLNNDHNLTQGGGPHMDARNLAGSKLPNDPTLPTRGFPGFVLFPQNLNGWNSSSVHDAIRLIRLVAKKYNVDENRIYIHGLSNGGAGVYDALKRAPWLFTAALPMSAISEGGIIAGEQTPQISHIPLWIFQGAKDTSPSPGRTNGYVKAFREAGAVVKYTVYPNLGHGTWNTAYREPDFFMWMLSKNKAKIHTFSGTTAICLTNGQGVRMELAQGFLKYQWQRNGVTISGATGATYTAETPGVYRARFSRVLNPTEAQWNIWSDNVTITEANPAQAVVQPIGTVLLKDLNNGVDAKLKAVGEFVHYYWYKDGVLLDLPGTQDDTIQNPIIKAGTCTGECTGNGVYTLVTAGYENCPSMPSDPINIYFNNQAPIDITAPTNFAGTIFSPGTIKLTWSDNATNEKGYEIWSRRKFGTSSYTSWTMRTLTDVNMETFTDTGLEPSSTYNYKIRAVSNGGRSEYTPAVATQYLVLTTTKDEEVPSIPLNLVAKTTGIKTITLTWSASTDNTRIKRYKIYYGSTIITTTSSQTIIELSGLDLNMNYTFTVRAEDLGGNLSASSNSASADTFVKGLYWEHSTGAWGGIDLIDWSNYEFAGTINNFSLTPRTQEDFFNFKFEGYLYITTGGSYQFRTVSDDGSRVELDSVVVVDNDGVHENKTVTGAIQTLTSGPKAIVVRYFEYTASQTLSVRYKGPDTGNLWVTIPDAALQSGTEPLPAVAARLAAGAENSTDQRVFNSIVYPNPAPGHNVYVKLSTKDDSPVYVRLIDLAGKAIINRIYDAKQIREGVQIVSNEALVDGMYILLVNQNKFSQQHTISIKN